MKQANGYFSVARQPGEGYRAFRHEGSDSSLAEQDALDLLDQFPPSTHAASVATKGLLIEPRKKRNWLVHVSLSHDERGNVVFSQYWYRPFSKGGLGKWGIAIGFLLGWIVSLPIIYFRAPHPEASMSPDASPRRETPPREVPQPVVSPEPKEQESPASHFEEMAHQQQQLLIVLQKTVEVRRKLLDFMTQEKLGFVSEANPLKENAWIKLVAISERGPPPKTGEDLTTYDGKALITLLETLDDFASQESLPDGH